MLLDTMNESESVCERAREREKIELMQLKNILNCKIQLRMFGSRETDSVCIE